MKFAETGKPNINVCSPIGLLETLGRSLKSPCKITLTDIIQVQDWSTYVLAQVLSQTSMPEPLYHVGIDLA